MINIDHNSVRVGFCSIKKKIDESFKKRGMKQFQACYHSQAKMNQPIEGASCFLSDLEGFNKSLKVSFFKFSLLQVLKAFQPTVFIAILFESDANFFSVYFALSIYSKMNDINGKRLWKVLNVQSTPYQTSFSNTLSPKSKNNNSFDALLLPQVHNISYKTERLKPQIHLEEEHSENSEILFTQDFHHEREAEPYEQSQQPMMLSTYTKTITNEPLYMEKWMEIKNQLTRLKILQEDVYLSMLKETLRYNEMIEYVKNGITQKLLKIWEEGKKKQDKISELMSKINEKDKKIEKLQKQNHHKAFFCEKIQNLEIEKQNIDSEYNQQINMLESQIQEHITQRDVLNETIFDLNQKVAQADLEVCQKVKKILNQENDKISNRFKKQIIRLEEEIQRLSEQLIKQSNNQQTVNDKIQKLNQKEADIVQKEKYLEEQYQQLAKIHMKIESQEHKMKRKEEQLHAQQHKLHRYKQQLENKQKQMEILINEVQRTDYLKPESSKPGYNSVYISNHPTPMKKIETTSPKSNSFMKEGKLRLNTDFDHSLTTNRSAYSIIDQKHNASSHGLKYVREQNSFLPSKSQYKGGSKKTTFANSFNRVKSRDKNKILNLNSKLERIQSQIRHEINSIK